MKVNNHDTPQPKNGRAIHRRVGPLLIRAYYELPPQSWKRFQMNVDIKIYDKNER